MVTGSKLHAVAAGLKSYVPWIGQYRGTGGSTSARYCYAVWWRHLRVIAEAGALRPLRSVVELGPGDSLGVSLAALLSGARRVTALDVVAHNDPERDWRVFDELNALFKLRADVPGDDELPGVYPAASAAPFPAAVHEAIAVTRVTPERRRQIGEAIGRRDGAADLPLRYLCPWRPDAVAPGTVDCVLSQAVLQDIDREPGSDLLDAAFAAMASWVAPGGLISHQIDLSAPLGRAWNDHWTASDLTWRLVRGRRPYFFNRVPLSGYLALCDRHGFDVLRVTPVVDRTGRGRRDVAPRFRALPDDDFITRAVHLVARRRR